MSGRARRVKRLVAFSFLLLSGLCLSSYGGSRNASPGGAREEKHVVYVCACLKTKSCSCMTMAKTGGFCACGPKGGPALKAVPADGDWAKENREALAN